MSILPLSITQRRLVVGMTETRCRFAVRSGGPLSPLFGSWYRTAFSFLSKGMRTYFAGLAFRYRLQ